ncbi:MAG: DUF4982 domain-containing protein [Clostridia bacterium]|nr:DUF4982 domain-containing protein [Clostridia bacterium]
MERFAGYGSWLLNDGWSFRKMPLGSAMEDARSPEGWLAVQLPHDWLIWQASDLYESADAWYRRELTLPPDRAERILLGFDGVYMDCDILLNGRVICSHPYGYTAFRADLTDGLLPGRNELMVHIRHRSPNSRWYSGSGIFRDVTLSGLPADHMVQDSLYTASAPAEGGWFLRASVETVGQGRVRFRLLSPGGDPVVQAEAQAADGKAEARLFIPGGELWSPAHPALYTLICEMGPHRESCRLGLRTLRFDPDAGFFLNGEHTKLRGVCNHHDLGALGAAFHPAAARRQLRIMQEMGVNALRTSHNPPARALLDLCDEMGILVADEIFDMWERPKTEFDYARFFPAHEAEDVAAWIRRDRNHPCVVLWSIGNEIYDMFADERGTEVTRILTDQVRAHDPEGHAAVTFGSNYMPWEGAQRCAEVVKIPGYNYAEKLYAAHHAAHPDWVIYGSETASVLSSRNIYHFPLSQTILSDADLQCSSLGNSVTSWGAGDLAKMIVDDLNTPYSMGQFIWSGFDYIGEPTPYHTRSCYFGQVDTAGFPKDAYYLFQSLWTDAPMIHIGVYWDWNPGQPVDIRVLSNCPRAELFLNGRSLGVRILDRRDPARCYALWQAPYEPGVLRAVGMDAEGNILCEAERRSFGDTAALGLTPEKETLAADGRDMTFVTLQALDRDGNPVENARDRVEVEVSGGAVLLGLDNGDPADTDEYKGTSRRLFGGKLLLMVGSAGVPEPGIVSVRTSAGVRAELRLETAAPSGPVEPFLLQPVPVSATREEIPVRKVEIIPLGACDLNPDRPEALFAYRVLPENATPFSLSWQVTTATGIPTPCAEVRAEGDRIRVIARGDGTFWLRALFGNAPDHPERISQLPLTVSGMGRPGLDPYAFVTAGLYDLSQGDIGPGNDRGIAFARDSGKSLVGFSGVDFGEEGSDRLTLSIFTLDDHRYDLRVYDGEPGKGGRLITVLAYQKKSIWNVYQDETYTLPERLRGVHTLCFEAEAKFHFRGFRFDRQTRAYAWQRASDADIVYGDSFTRDGSAVREIGNNVTLAWEGMDFGAGGPVRLTVEGATPLDTNAITLRLANAAGDTATEALRFRGPGKGRQTFDLTALPGKNTVSFVFLPGSRFDLEGFRFEKKE